MSDLELCYLPALRQIEMFRAREVSPVEVLEAQIARAEAVEPVVNAFTETFFDQARDQARHAEKIYMARTGEARPLEGLTVGIKDEMDVAGQRNTSGSLIYKEQIATEDHPVAARLRDAGAIFHARTTTPEFCCAWVTSSRLYGTTTNPWHCDFTCSSSSGGSAASLAAGTSSLATGSDIAGSIRGPAAACGVVGYKPPYGRVPDLPPFNLDPYNTVGPLARHVTDCALMQNVIAGHHPGDIATLREQIDIPLQHEGVKGLTLAYTLDVGNEVLADDVRAHTLQALDRLADQGAIIEHVDLGWTRETTYAARDYLDFGLGHYLQQEATAHPDLVCDYTAFLAERSKTATVEKVYRSQELAAEMYSSIAPVLERAHAMICPAFITHEVRAEQPLWETMIVSGREIDTDYEFHLLPQFNMLNRLPVLAVPTGIADSGLPMGVQVVGRSFDDPRVFRVAAALEQVTPFFDCAAHRPNL
ncbi:amidase [uncultured Roseovarius sp.]|uniref:amidase n=1 Tax=uncultured Roseovarius sp. TaxID=293344 RepID=UPI00262BC6DB|nr:amidase [uncultured Roseovarius sp.]